MTWLGEHATSVTMLFGRAQVSTIKSRVSRAHSPDVPESIVRAALSECGLHYESAIETVSDCAVILARRADGDPAVLKIASSRKGVERLRHEQEALARLHARTALGEWRGLLPVVLGGGNVAGGSYVLMSRLPGVDARHGAGCSPEALTGTAFSAIAPLHRLDAGVCQASAGLIREYVDTPVARLRAIAVRPSSIDRLAASLQDALAGRFVSLGWTHGDFFAGNVVLGAGQQVTGIVDWGHLREHDLVALDLAFWLLTMPAPDEPREFGARVAARLLADQQWSESETRLLRESLPACSLGGPALLLLTWLRHITDNLDKSDRFAGPLWYRRNVVPVLRLLDRGVHLGGREGHDD